MDVDWASEPDLEKLREAQALIGRNTARAIVELRALADRGSVMSIVYLADIFENGRGIDRNDLEAERLYKQAYALGSHIAMFNLGAHYFNRKNYKMADEVFSIGSSRGDSASTYHLARIYLLDRSVPDNVERARKLLEEAASAGHILAKKRLALLLMKERYGWRNKMKGLWMFLKVPCQGCKVALRDLSSPLLR